MNLHEIFSGTQAARGRWSVAERDWEFGSNGTLRSGWSVTLVPDQTTDPYKLLKEIRNESLAPVSLLSGLG